jgi:transposase
MRREVKALVDGVDEFIGIDHHKLRSQVLVRDREGKVLRRGRIASRQESLWKFLGPPNGRVRMAVFEAGPRYRPMYRWLRDLVDQPVLANPGRLKLISQTAYKDDEIDTEKLTDLLMLGMIPEAYACSDEAWDRRQFLRQRAVVVRMRAALKNRIHAVIDLHPEAKPERPRGTDLFGKQGMFWLRRVELPKTDRKRLDQLLGIYDYLSEEIRKTDKQVYRMAKADPQAQHLTTIPGIGDFFALLILAEVDDIHRFKKSKHFVSYTGLVPGRDQSGEKDHRGRIHKRGSRWLRWALVEAAIPATRSNLALKNLYDRICCKKGPDAGPNLAKVAVARKLAEIVYRVLMEDRAYEVR